MATAARLRRWWRGSGASRAAKALLRLLPSQAVLPILSGPLRGRKWIVRSSFESCWFGVYEREKQKEFAAAVRPGAVVYDVGANVGFYTLLAATLAGPQGRVYAFEPLPRNVRILTRHAALNRLTNVHVFAGAVSDRPGTARFDQCALPEMGRLSASGGIEVLTFQLDDLLASGRIPPPHVVKIDVEGAEWDVLRGARDVFLRHRPTVLLATHGPEVHARCCALLGELGYDLEPLDDRPLERSSEIRGVARSS
jgi:FkbM family methyltransferase